MDSTSAAKDPPSVQNLPCGHGSHRSAGETDVFVTNVRSGTFPDFTLLQTLVVIGTPDLQPSYLGPTSTPR